MEMTITASGESEILKLATAIASTLKAEPATEVVAENTKCQEKTPVEATAPKAKRGRPKKETPAPEVSAVTETPSSPADEGVEYETVTDEPPCDAEGLKAKLVKKADESEEMKEKVVELIKGFTTDGSYKTANIPAEKYAEVLAALETL